MKEVIAMPILLEVAEEKCDGRAVRDLSEQGVRKGLNYFEGVELVQPNPGSFVRDMRRVCGMRPSCKTSKVVGYRQGPIINPTC